MGIVNKRGFQYWVDDRRLVVNMPVSNRTFGVSKDILTIKEIKDFIIDFTKKLVNDNKKPVVIVKVNGVDRYNIINRISFRVILNDRDMIFNDVYCGGMYGADRIFQVLYNFEYLLSKTAFNNSNTFDHYAEYSLSNKYVMLDSLFNTIGYE